MNDSNSTITVEDVRKLALPLGTRVVTGDGALNRPATWTTVIYPEDSLASKLLQPGEIVLVAAHEGKMPVVSPEIEIIR